MVCVKGEELTASSGFLDSLLMGIVLAQMFKYWPFVRTDKKHIVLLVVSPISPSFQTGMLIGCSFYPVPVLSEPASSEFPFSTHT